MASRAMTYYEALVRSPAQPHRHALFSLACTHVRPAQGVSPTATAEDIRRVRAAPSGQAAGLCGRRVWALSPSH